MNELKKKFTINISIAILLVAAFLYVGGEYLVKDVETYSGQIVKDEQSAYTQEAKNSQLPDLRKRYEEITAKMDKAFESIIGKEDTVTFIEEAEKAAIRNKVKLEIQNKGADKNEKQVANATLSTSNFNFRAGGTFDNVMHFLGEMENFRYCSEITSVSLDYADYDEYNKNMVILKFDVKLYQENSQEK